jgi:hypothetical protein
MRLHSPRFLLVSLALSPLLLAQDSVSEPDTELELYLQQVREHLGTDQPGEIVQTSGKTTRNGMPASYRWVFGPDGFFRRDMRGTFPESVGYAGSDVRRVEGRSPAHSLSLLEEERWLTIAWIWSGLWSLPDSPFLLKSLPAEKAGVTRLEIRLEKGRLAGTLEINDETHLPHRLLFQPELGAGSFEFEAWNGDLKVALPWKVTEIDHRGTTTEYLAQDARPWTGVRPAFYPAAPPRLDFQFLEGVSTDVKVRRVEGGQIFVQPKIDGQLVGWFLLDSGLGSSIITKDTADLLKLGSFGQTRLMGITPQAQLEVPLRQSHVLQLGPLLIEGLVMIEAPSMALADSMLNGERCAGALGWDVFLRSIVELDPRTDRLKIHDPARYSSILAHWESLLFYRRGPYLRAVLEGQRLAYLGLDTGAGELTALFQHSAVRRLGLQGGSDQDGPSDKGDGPLLSPPEWSLALRSRRGRQAPTIRLASAELKWFEVGGERHSPAVVYLSTEPDDLSDPYTAGFLGTGFFSEQRLIFDYANQRLGLVALD